MAGIKGKSGRHKSDVEVKGVYLRIPPALLKRVEHCHWLLQRQHGPKTTQNTAFWHILEAGCATLEGALEGRETPAPAHMSIFEISKISNRTPMAYDDMLGFLGDEEEEETPAQPVDMPQASETPTAAAELTAKQPAKHALPRAKLEAIADERTLCEGLSLREFAQRLHAKGIYSATAKDGSSVPVNAGTLGRWLEQAREAALL